MKKLVVMAMLLALSAPLYANCGNDNGNGNGCSGNEGPAGPQGPSGTNGGNGVNGKDGAVGPAANSKAAMIAGLELRLFDTRYVSMFAFDNYQLDAQPSHDLIGGGAKNSSYGAKLVFKLGRDYTEDKIEKLERRLKALEALQ